jgi:hypothetical protein
MLSKTCRDCGKVLEQNARGCPRCALNFEAENLIGRFLWLLLAPSLLLIVLGVVVAVYLLR